MNPIPKIETRDWKHIPDFVSDKIQNYGTMIQHPKDNSNDKKKYNEMMKPLFDFLYEKHRSSYNTLMYCSNSSRFNQVAKYD